MSIVEWIMDLYLILTRELLVIMDLVVVLCLKNPTRLFKAYRDYSV
jgi:hypothetical protein